MTSVTMRGLESQTDFSANGVMGSHDFAPPASGADLRALQFFAHLNDGEAEAVFGSLGQRQVKKGATLVLSRDFSERVGFVWSGLFQLNVALPPKRTVSLSKLKRGALFGHVPPLVGSHFGEGLRVVCYETGVVLEMAADRFSELRSKLPALAEATLASLSKIAADQGGRIYELSVLSARERIQAELLRLARDGEWNGRRSIITPAPTHQELADQIGAAREVVTRCLRALADEELIRIERGVLEVRDIDRLLALDRAATGRTMFDPDRYAKKP